MECTQKLECTQELYETHTEKTCPEQIGFLGICGAKHPVLKGPNKIGRDPQICNIILNLNSVSRQHAVINVLNSREFMLMDLDSANKTKLLNKILQPYIPHPLRDGDTVQFGDIFGVFRLLEEDDALPMTQAISIPETPAVAIKHVSKLYKAPTTIVPESPDVSDRDDSFITPSQPKGGKSRLPSNPFIKPNNKTQAQPETSPKTYSNRKSSKRSTSLSFIDNPNTSLNESFISLKSDKNIAVDIHEADTQVPTPLIADESTDSIFTADTQIPPEGVTLSIHSLDTQVPSTEHLPQVRKIDGQHEMQLDIYAANKENNRDIFNAETRPLAYDNDSTEIVNKNNLRNKTKSDCSAGEESKDKLNTSEEELLFDDVDGESLEEDFCSQNILQDEIPFKENATEQPKTTESPIPSKRHTRIVSDGSTDCEEIEEDLLPTQKIPELPSKENNQQVKFQGKTYPKCSKRIARIKSDSSTDCEDIHIAPTQVIPALPSIKDTVKEKDDKKSNINPSKRSNRILSDSSTDCEDVDLILTQKVPPKKVDDEDVTDCEDDVIEINTKKPHKGEQIQDDIATQIIDLDDYKYDKQSFEDMPTQIIDICEVATNSKNVAFEDLPTQIIDEVVSKNINHVKKSFDEIVSPFKIPLQSPIRVKSKDIPKVISKDKTDKNKSLDLDDNYYNATQDIYEDLCSQKEKSNKNLAVESNADDEVVPCSVEDFKVKDVFANIERDLSPTRKGDRRENIICGTKLPSQEKKDVIGESANVTKLKKVPSDSSDLECTPKKVKQFIFTDSDLPDSQEIRTSMRPHTRSAVTESSSESETENYSEDQFTPFLHRKKKTKPVPKVDLTKMFGIENLPERVITRQRKPTFKLLSGGEVTKNQSASILKPSYLTEQEDQIDGDIITENIKRLKTLEKSKTNKDSKNHESVKEDKKENTSRKKTGSKSNEPKEKIKVKIEKPKRKNTKSKTESSPRKSAELEINDTKENSLDSTSDAKTTTRRTRSRKNENDSKNTEKKSVSPENNKKEPDNKRKRTNKKQEKERSVSPEIEVRRSKRQLKAKEKNDDTMKAPKSILKNSIHEQSTVYNISSSSSESPKSLKRSLVDDSEVPSSKRTRSHNTNNNSSITNASLRATPARVMKTHHVLFTAFPSAEVKEKLEKLGAVIVTDVMECSVVLTMQIKRTFKLLCAVGLGRPIVGPGWVQACVDTNIIVDPWLYLVKDESAENRFHFNLYKTLNSKRNFLKGYNVSSTPSVQPNASEMKLIVECSGGTWKEGGPNWVCVSCTKDNGLWPALRKRGATIVSTEFILGGVLRQKIDIASNTFS